MIYFYLQSFLLSKIVPQIQTFYWLGQKVNQPLVYFRPYMAYDLSFWESRFETALLN